MKVFLTRRGWHAVNPSTPVLYRKIDQQRPTLLLDEMDNYPVNDRRDALSVLNTGYKRGARVDRCKDDGTLESFSCFCPKAYAGLDDRSIVDTLLSRSITVRLERQVEGRKGRDVDRPGNRASGRAATRPLRSLGAP